MPNYAYIPKRRDFLAEWETLDISPNLEFTSETWSFRETGVLSKDVSSSKSSFISPCCLGLRADILNVFKNFRFQQNRGLRKPVL